jgi:tetratricopeptide (TPR) repeat protein
MRGTVAAESAERDLARELTGSVDAYRAYVRGETLLHRFKFEQALEQFREAVRIDPEFALAHYRMSLVPLWLGNEAASRAPAERAVALLDRLPASYRDIVRANLFFVQGAYSQAIPLLESILSREPDNKEALFLLSDAHMHSARDSDPERAVRLMEECLRLDPDFHLVYHHLALAYGLLGDFQKAREKLAYWETKVPETVQSIPTILMALENRPEEALGLSASISGSFGTFFRGSMAMVNGRWDLAREIVFRESGQGSVRARALRNRGHFHVYRGEFDRAVLAYRQAVDSMELRAGEGLEAGTPASVLQSLAELLDLKGDRHAARLEAERALGLQPESPRCLYYAGVFALKDGDPGGARAYLDRMEEVLEIARNPGGEIYAQGLEAELALAGGEAAEARELFERALSSGNLYHDYYATSSVAGTGFRDGLARALLAQGKREEAARALEALLGSGFERVDHPVLHLRALYTLGKLELATGDRAKGKKLLQDFLNHYGEADWSLPEIAEARARL